MANIPPYRLKTPIDLQKEKEKKVSFSDRWEEELKKQLFEEENADEVVKAADPTANIWVHHKRPGEEWDVPITEPIRYFDPELSYELTGYRPITMDQGLDFDPTPFKERATIYNETGHYTQFQKGRKSYNDFWDVEYDRCEKGYSVGKYTITGDNYFYLNYYRMDVIDEDAIGGEGRSQSFPAFLAKQYEWFHYVEMARRLSLDACALKARGVN